MHEATLLFTFLDATATTVHRALAPETEAQVPKTRAEVSLRGGDVRVHILAEDLSGLRAAVNSYARWVDAAERAARLAGEGHLTRT